MKILLIEDDEQTAALISTALTTHHYLVNTTDNGQTGLELTKAYDYDLIVLDVLLPGIDGFSLCRQLRGQGCAMPILMLTAKNSSSDRIKGLEAGADDYVVKPFDLSELVARVKALLRRRKDSLHTVLTWENLQLNLDINAVSYNAQQIHLTPKEYGLLELFMRNPRRIFNRGSLLDNVWNVDEFPGERAVTTQIKGLRQKLKKAGLSVELIETVYGLGYRLKPDPLGLSHKPVSETPTQDNTNRENDSSLPAPQSALGTRAQAEADVADAIAQVWEKFKEKLPATFLLFERISDYLKTGTLLEPELKREAILTAHRLIGTLGAFSLPEGADLARNIEQLLQSQTLGTQDTLQFSEWVEALMQVISQGRAPKTPQATVSLPDYSEPPIHDRLQGLATVTRLLVVDDDADLTHQIRIAAQSHDFNIEIAANLSEARQAVAKESFNAILLDLTFTETGENGLTFLSEMVSQNPALPVLVMTGRKRLTDRVEVARLGGRTFFQKPIAPGRLLQMVDQVLNQVREVGRRVLVVDDDPLILTALVSLLEPWGLQVSTLENPVQFWEMIESFTPDLLVLDIEMPQFNGLELCQAVRNDPYWGEIPILFLTAHQDPEMIRRVFMVGADDYVRKPIIEPELVARVLNRLERVRARQKWVGNTIELAPALRKNAQDFSAL